MKVDPTTIWAATVWPPWPWRLVFRSKGLEAGGGFDQRAIDAEVLVAEQVNRSACSTTASKNSRLTRWRNSLCRFLETCCGQSWARACPCPSQLQGTLVLPGIVIRAYLQTFEDNVHIWSSFEAHAVDFGAAGPAFTTFRVIAPQVGSRIFVFNPESNNYGWIDVAGVGPVAPPEAKE
jgi:hypothetical protein